MPIQRRDPWTWDGKGEHAALNRPNSTGSYTMRQAIDSIVEVIGVRVTIVALAMSVISIAFNVVR